MTADATYAFANENDGGVARFGALESIFDATTTRHMAACGVAPGWTCLEIGGGGGSIVKWLASRVGPSGRVVATDLNTRCLEGLGLSNVAVLRHDIASEPVPEDTFDLLARARADPLEGLAAPADHDALLRIALDDE